MQKPNVEFFEIDENSANQRLDNFLMRKLKGVPKSLIYKLVRKGQIRINGKRCKPLTKLEFADLVRVAPIVTSAQKNLHLSEALANQLRQNILWETQDYLILNKPAGLASHAGGGVDLGTIEAMKILRETENLFLAHRLDKGTSGCLMIAKNRLALLALQDLYKKRQIKKNYIALVVGNWQIHIKKINAPLLIIGGEDSKKVLIDEKGKYAETNFEFLQNLADFSLISASPITGRTHQIRVHCQAAGFPILGDDKYGNIIVNKEIAKKGFQRLFLHAQGLEFIDPFTDEKIKVESKLDKNWLKFLDFCKNKNWILEESESSIL